MTGRPPWPAPDRVEQLLAGASPDPRDPGEARLTDVVRRLTSATAGPAPRAAGERAALQAFRTAARDRAPSTNQSPSPLPGRTPAGGPTGAAADRSREAAREASVTSGNGREAERAASPVRHSGPMLNEVPSPHDPHVVHMRRMFLAVVTGSFLFLIPWIAYLSASLPDHHEVDQWRLAWVGFDAALIAAIGITALCAWRRLQLFIPWAVITATLLCCDAWFDIVLDWNSDELTGAILTAACAELPLAILLLYVARKMIRLTVLIAWHRAGRPGPVPPLSRLSMIVLTSEEEREREWQREGERRRREPLDQQGTPERQGTPGERGTSREQGTHDQRGTSGEQGTYDHRHHGDGHEDDPRPRDRGGQRHR